MPDRNRNRIAGRRRPTPDRGPQDTPGTPDTEPDATPETPGPEVTRTTPATPEPAVQAILEGELATLSDEGRARVAALVTDSDLEIALKAQRDTEAALARGSGRGLSAVLSAVLAVLIVVILAFAGILGLKAWKGQQAEDARGEAAAAGRKAAETALSYDYRSLDKSFAAARATMTPDFATKFDETAKVAGELATKTKATVRAEVREVGVRDGDADRVTLIIFVNQTTTSTITEGKPRVDLNRTRFTMVRNGDQWLVQEIAGL